MGNPQRDAKVTAWEAFFFKVFPLIGFAFVPFSVIPEVRFIDPDWLPKIWGQMFWIAPVVAFLIEMARAWPQKNERGHFGVPLLAFFSILSGILAANYWFEFYHLGNSSWIDMLIYMTIIFEAMILMWAARVELFKHKKLRYSIYQQVSQKG